MTPEEKQQLNALLMWKQSLEASNTIPLNVDQSFTRRFHLPTIKNVTLDIGNANSQTASSVTVHIPGASIGDLVVVTPPAAAVVGIGSFTAYVSAPETVTIVYANPSTSSSWDPASGVFSIALFQK